MPYPKNTIERVLKRVTVEGDCWIIPTGTNRYGRVMVDGRIRMAHRFVYESLVGPVDPGLQLDHLCRITACVNPDHLEPVTCRVNLHRAPTVARLNAAKTHCVNGHPFNDANTYVSPTDGHRRCRPCAARSQARYRDRQVA